MSAPILTGPVIQNMALWDRLYIASLQGLSSHMPPFGLAEFQQGHAERIAHVAQLLATEAYHVRLRMLEALQEGQRDG